MHVVCSLRADYPQLLLGLPLAGLLIVWLYHRCNVYHSLGTNLVLLSVRTREQVPLLMTPLIFVSTLLTHLCGGSSGREGAALQMGGSIGQQIGRMFKVSERSLHIFTMCGMSACFAALFGTPVAASVFSIEVVSVGIMHYSALIPCSVAALTADAIARFFEVEHMRFTIPDLVSSFDPVTGLRVCLLAIACAIVSMLFCILLHSVDHAYKRFFKNQYLRAFVGGLLIIALTILLGTDDYLSVGEAVLKSAIHGTARPEAFLLKMLFTALTLEAGFKGGEIVPTLFIGATFGCVTGPLLGLSASFGASLGMIALFCGVTNCPLTSILLGLELFGGKGIEWFLIVAAISYMLSGYYGLYSKQKILYSKETPEFIDTTVG
jgi:H+/Cl- antiporter ClcA